MYEKQAWTTGETITAEKLNHIEGGFQVMAVTIDDSTLTSDAGYDDILDAMKSGAVVLARHFVGNGDMVLAIESGTVDFFTGTLAAKIGNSTYSLQSGNTWTKS